MKRAKRSNKNNLENLSLKLANLEAKEGKDNTDIQSWLGLASGSALAVMIGVLLNVFAGIAFSIVVPLFLGLGFLGVLAGVWFGCIYDGKLQKKINKTKAQIKALELIEDKTVDLNKTIAETKVKNTLKEKELQKRQRELDKEWIELDIEERLLARLIKRKKLESKLLKRYRKKCEKLGITQEEVNACLQEGSEKEQVK